MIRSGGTLENFASVETGPPSSFTQARDRASTTRGVSGPIGPRRGWTKSARPDLPARGGDPRRRTMEMTF